MILNMARFDFSPTKQKIALLLLAGVTLGFTRSPKTQWCIVKGLPRAFESIDRGVLNRILKEFYHERLVDFRVARDGTATLILTEKGNRYALRFKIDELSIPTPPRWDKKWRVVIFDIPEKYKKAREALRNKLRDIGFLQLQKSVWIYPYPCKKEIDFIAEVFGIRPYVQYLEVIRLSNDAKLMLYFKLTE